jgi:hypothetical protein
MNCREDKKWSKEFEVFLNSDVDSTVKDNGHDQYKPSCVCSYLVIIVCNLYSSPNVVMVIKLRRMKWTGPIREFHTKF